MKRKKLNKSKLDIVHKGDLLKYEKTLILCERKISENQWEFSYPFGQRDVFTLTKEEIEALDKW